MQGPNHGHDEHPQRFLSNMVVTSKVHVTTLHDCLLLSNQPSPVMDCNLIRAAHLGYGLMGVQTGVGEECIFFMIGWKCLFSCLFIVSLWL